MPESIDWSNVHENNTEEFSFKGITIEGKCVKVYDGDSIKVVIPFANKLSKITIRLISIDTPEMKDLNQKVRDYAYFVRDRLRDKIFDKLITVELHDNDKYGRCLANVYLKDAEGNKEHINKWLLDNKYAIAYNGGLKSDWSSLI